MKKETVVITGAAGAIGQTVVEALKADYDLLLIDRVPHPQLKTCEVDLCSLQDLLKALPSASALIHLAAIPEEAAPEQIIQNNIVSTYNVFEAARQRDVKRVIFASSIMTYMGIDISNPAQPLNPTDDTSPATHYAVSKIYGESLGQMYSTVHGLSVICLRLGAFPRSPVDYEVARQYVHTVLSVHDCQRLFRCCLKSKQVDYAIINGLSKPAAGHFDLQAGQGLLGYQPQDDGEAAIQQHIERVGQL